MKVFRYIVISIAVLILIFSAGYFLVGYYYNNTGNLNNTISTTREAESEIDTIIYSLEDPPSESLRGQIATMSGEIYWQGRIATESSQIFDPQEILQGESVSIKKDSDLTIEFDNACIIEMSENTSVNVIQTLPINLVFRQSDGSAVFNRTGENPLSVRTLSLLSDINGKAKITIDKDKNTIYLEVISGSTTVAYNDLEFISRQMTIEENQTYTFNQDTRKGVLR